MSIFLGHCILWVFMINIGLRKLIKTAYIFFPPLKSYMSCHHIWSTLNTSNNSRRCRVILLGDSLLNEHNELGFPGWIFCWDLWILWPTVHMLQSGHHRLKLLGSQFTFCWLVWNRCKTAVLGALSHSSRFCWLSQHSASIWVKIWCQHIPPPSLSFFIIGELCEGAKCLAAIGMYLRNTCYDSLYEYSIYLYTVSLY